MKILENIFKKPRLEKDGIFFSELEKILGFTPNKLEYYARAFIHSSSNKTDENGKQVNYERLEFLGDAMLSSVIAAYLFKQVPEANEGYLTKMRSKIVSREHLNELGRDLALIRFVDSKVPSTNFGENIHGNIFEALIGAIFLDRGYSYCEKFIHERVIVPYVDIDKLEGKITSYKSLFIEWCQKEKHTFYYEIFEDSGRETQKHYGVKLLVDGKIVARARATSKKKAEEKASHRAYFAFQEKIAKKNS